MNKASKELGKEVLMTIAHISKQATSEANNQACSSKTHGDSQAVKATYKQTFVGFVCGSRREQTSRAQAIKDIKPAGKLVTEVGNQRSTLGAYKDLE